MSQSAEPSNPSRNTTLGRGLREAIRTLVVLVLIMVGVPLACFATYLIYLILFPAYSASMQIPGLRTTLTLRYFYIWDEQTEHGRYLTIQTPHGHTKIAMADYDWAHNSRTSVYLTSDQNIAIVGTGGDDYLVSLNSLTTKNARGISDDWTYLGAFDFEDFQTAADSISRRWRELHFIRADEQGECIPMHGSTVDRWQVRKAARQYNCKEYTRPKIK